MAAALALPARLLMAFAALAMIAVPVFITDGGGAHAARMNAPAMSADHCTEMPETDGHDQKEGPSNDCITACLVAHFALASEGDVIPVRAPLAPSEMTVRNIGRLVGHPPGIDPPPPRAS